MLIIVDRVTNLPLNLLNTLVRQVPDSRTVSVGYVRCAEHLQKFPTGEQFNLPGHTENNMKVMIQEGTTFDQNFYVVVCKQCCTETDLF